MKRKTTFLNACALLTFSLVWQSSSLAADAAFVFVGYDGAVGITLRDNTLLSAGPNSTLDLNKFAFNTTTHAGELNASVKRGTLAVVSGKIAKTSPENVSFNTPTISLGVRGTEFVIDAGKGVE